MDSQSAPSRSMISSLAASTTSRVIFPGTLGVTGGATARRWAEMDLLRRWPLAAAACGVS